MNKYDILQQLTNENNGYLLASMVAEEHISKTYLARYVKENGMERVARGIYAASDVWPDELYILQARNSAVIFSGETALYLHGLLDREYSQISVTVPVGYNAAHFKSDHIQVKYASNSLYGLGVCSTPSISGNMVRAYDKERCICDVILNRNRMEVQVFQTAIKQYMSGKDRKLQKLLEYAKTIGIRDEVMKYVEVLV